MADPADNAKAETSHASASCPGAPDLLIEHLTPDWGYFVRSAAMLEAFHSGLQDVEVHQTTGFGTLFRLDGHFMTSEKDEFFYHENLIHTAGITHGAPETALIIGGGDGGSAEELLKYSSMKQITLVEIDAAVVDISRRHLAKVHHGSLDHPKVALKIEDGFAYIKTSRDQYDLIVLDLTDPGGPSTLLYTPEFYRACAERLGPQGIMTLHIASPAQSHDTLARLADAFTCVVPYLTSVPLYGGLWMMAFCSNGADPRILSAATVDARLQQLGITQATTGPLQYYNGAMHHASMALPNFVRAMLPPALL